MLTIEPGLFELVDMAETYRLFSSNGACNSVRE